ncbi:MAG TPA: right-handed parallel beta-helix repeat-containing protein [Bryobacteraceae bacterium]|nr:right-handed parallel beta-helix repeat-containing protein [Bryobacteraceae bacterium]
MKLLLCAISITALAYAADSAETVLRSALTARTGSVSLPTGVIEISREIALPPDVHDLDIRGSGTTLKASDSFRGRALISIPAGRNVKIHDLTLDGNREVVGHIAELPPAGTAMSRFVAANGIVAENVTGLEVGPIKATNIAGFAILVSGSHQIRIHHAEVTGSGGWNSKRRNSGAGGVAIEEGSSDFQIDGCLFGVIRGSAITILASSKGKILENEFRALARDAIVVRQGTGIAITRNHADQIGVPLEEVDSPGALCMRLERFDDGEISGNACAETLMGAVSVSGSRNVIRGNHFTGLNNAHSDAAGIFLGQGSKDITVEANELSGSGMSLHCIGAAPQVAPGANKILKNDCSDETSVALLRPATPR